MKIKKLVALLIAFAMVFALAACGGSSAPASPGSSAPAAPSGSTPAPSAPAKTDDGKVYEISIGHGAAETTIQHLVSVELGKALEEKSGGRFHVTVYPNCQLGANREMTEALIEGSLTMMNDSTGAHALFVQDSSVFDLPFYWETEDDVKHTIYDPGFLAAMDESHAPAGMKLMNFSVNLFRQLSANVPIHTPDDCKGIVIRTQENKFQMKTWNLCGMNATPLAFNELYTALQQGTVEAQDNPLDLFTAQKFYEQQKYFIRVNYIPYALFWFCNLDWYNDLPDDLRAIYDECCAEVIPEATARLAGPDNEAKEKFLNEYGCTIIDLTTEEHNAFVERVTPVWDDIHEVISDKVWDALEATMK